MTTRFKFVEEKKGGHVHIQVFVGTEQGTLALAGELVFRLGEASAFKSHFPELEPPHCKCESWYVGHSRDCPEWKEP
jgi:hypothetical protein